MLNTNGKQPIDQEFRTRKQRRAHERRKKQRRVGTSVLALLFAIPIAGAGATAVMTAQPPSIIDVAEMFPNDVTDFRTFTPANISMVPNPQVFDALEATMQENDASGEPIGSEYVDNFLGEIKAFNDFRENNTTWVGSTFAVGSYQDKTIRAYELTSRGEAEAFLESNACKTSFLQGNCKTGDHLIKNNWLLIGDTGTAEEYTQELENSLAENAEFAVQTKGVIDDSLASMWTDSSNITSFLPLDLESSFPTDAQVAMAVVPTEQGISMDGSIFQGESENPLFNKKPITDSIKRLPENTVMAISVSQTADDVQKMLEDEESFINTQDEWVALRKVLEDYGVSMPEDLEKILGHTTTFSLNKGSVGNQVAGTLRISDGDKKKITDVLATAAEHDDGITEMYTLKDGKKDMVIEAHSPIIKDVITKNPLFDKLVGDISDSVAVAFIDFDNTRALLNSEYKKPAEGYDKGVMGINFSNASDGVVDVSINWDLLTKSEIASEEAK